MRIEKLLGQRIYLDSNALIYTVETDTATQPPAVRSLLQAASSREVQAFVSPIVRAEVLVQPLRTGNEPLAEIYRVMLARSGPIVMVSVDDAVADLSAELRAKHRGLKLADALHLAAALSAGCQTFISGDKRIKAAAGRRIAVLSFEDIFV
ncbi:MAG: type II toxin-antitoxin system VapC family toxin [Gammaproteobacteria bacterium]